MLPDADTDIYPNSPDTDAAAEEGDRPLEGPCSDAPQFTFIYYEDTQFSSARELVKAADRVVMAKITDIGFERLNGSTSVLRSDVGEIPDDAGDIVTVYSAEVLEYLTPGGGRTGDTVEFRLYGGNTVYDIYRQQGICGDSDIPIVNAEAQICPEGVYLLLLDEHGGVMTLVDPEDGKYELENPYELHEITADSIMNELR